MRFVKTAGTILLWIVQILAALAFVAIGVAKFARPAWATMFARWGYPDGFYMVIGALELLGGVLLLVPRVTSYAAALLGVILVAATTTLVLHGESVRPPLLWLVVMVLLAWARSGRAWRPRFRDVGQLAKQV